MKVKSMRVKDGEQLGISEFPNFHKSGSIKGMKDKYYGKDALLIRCGNYIYKVGDLNDKTDGDMPYGQKLYFFHAK